MLLIYFLRVVWAVPCCRLMSLSSRLGTSACFFTSLVNFLFIRPLFHHRQVGLEWAIVFQGPALACCHYFAVCFSPRPMPIVSCRLVRLVKLGPLLGCIWFGFSWTGLSCVSSSEFIAALSAFHFLTAQSVPPLILTDNTRIALADDIYRAHCSSSHHYSGYPAWDLWNGQFFSRLAYSIKVSGWSSVLVQAKFARRLLFLLRLIFWFSS